ncbi:MAG: hypothetical protein JWO03_1069 [Bacteroidetes bacterium]|nr:hypothetical protein [Bacteroidota bacterium]
MVNNKGLNNVVEIRGVDGASTRSKDYEIRRVNPNVANRTYSDE